MTENSYNVFLGYPEHKSDLHLCTWHGPISADAFKSVFSALGALPELDDRPLKRLAFGKELRIEFVNTEAGEAYTCSIKVNKLP